MLYALSTMVIVVILISTIILISYYNFLQKTKFQEAQRLQHNVNSGIAVLLSNKYINYDKPQKLNLYQEGNDSVYLEKELYGMFDLIKSRTKWKNMSYEKVAFAGGYNASDTSLPALYLADHNSPLCLVGKSKIVGNCFLPRRGVQKGYIDGRNFEGKHLIKGKIKNSEKSIPSIKTRYENNLIYTAMQHYLQTGKYKKINLEDITSNSLVNSFCDTTEVIYDSTGILLGNINLKNNIVVLSRTEVLISGKAKLQNIVVYAPSIFIQAGFQGTLQCIASDTLYVGKNVSMGYPSALCLTNGITDTISRILKIEPETKINGLVCVNLTEKKDDPKPDIYIQKNVQLTGILYSNVPTRFFGKVLGSIYTDGFIVKRLSGIYINHLLDAVINRDSIPKNFVGPNLFNPKSHNMIMKWLN